MIIDVHGHWGPWFFPMDIAALETNLALMARYGIDAQIVSASEAVVYDAPSGNRALAEALEDQTRLYGYVVVNANDLEASERDLRELLALDRFVGAKVHTTYSGRPISHPATRELFALLAELGVVTLIHTWDAEVLLLCDILEEHPGLRVIAGHMGGPSWPLGIEAARRNGRLYLEPCGSVTDAGRIAQAAARVPAEQLLFGTDATLIDPAVALGSVHDAELPAATREALLWRNAARLFDLPSAAGGTGDPSAQDDLPTPDSPPRRPH